MRVLVHDYCGHPPQIQLSRELASRGHVVRHVFCTSVTSPRGGIDRRHDDPETFGVVRLSLGGEFAKYSPVTRLRQEMTYGRKLVAATAAFGPDVVISGNTPLLSQRAILRWCLRQRVPFTFWAQDLIGTGVRSVLRRRSELLGTTVGGAFATLEARLLRRSSAVVAIAGEFVPEILRAGVSASRVTVIENWAPIADFPALPRSNAWSETHGLSDKLTFLYAGTLGLKHNPERLVQLAEALRDRPEARVVVASEGAAAEGVAAKAAALGLDNVVRLPFQRYDDLPAMLASADVLIALLEEDAGVFSVPSKVLSYHAAGRPILASVPAANLSAAVIHRSGGGLVVDANDASAFVAEATRLADDPVARQRLSTAARRYAETAFRIDGIADRFEAVLTGTLDRPVEALRARPVEVMT